jgi:glycosyltransferase involved in cell wall biosynthesis
MNEKPIIAMDLTSSSLGGGPYTSTLRVMNSNLNLKYSYKTFTYNNELGRYISIRRILDLKRQIIHLKPDIVHFSGLQLSGFHIAVACRLAGIKNTVVTIHGFAEDDINLNPIKRFLLNFFFEPLTLILTSRFYGVSEYVVSRRNVKLFKKKCCGAIYNIPPDHYSSTKVSQIRTELGLNQSDIIGVTVARITKDKGYHILDKTIQRFKNERNLKFVIVGIGDYLSEMQENLSNAVFDKQVFFLKHRHDIQNILKGCDFFILPTLHETLSIALLEASVEGLALIASNTGGIPEIVENNYNGILVTAGDVNELANAIDLVYKDKELRNKFSKNAKKRVKEKFLINTIENKIDEIYQLLLKQ